MTVKIGIMSFAHLHAHSYADALQLAAGVELVGIADDNTERGKAAAQQYSTSYFESYEALLAENLDAVIITSENVHHAKLARLAFAAGRHVLCEKPICTTPADALEMIEGARNAGVQLMTAFPCRFSPAVERLRQAVLRGDVGRVVAIRGTNRGRCPFGWFVERKLSGGGAVIDHTVHVADLIRWITGAEFAQVYAEVSNGLYHQDWEDTGFLTFDLTDGAFATLDCSWSRPRAFPTWGDVTMAVVGEEGTITLDMFAQNLVHYSGDTDAVRWVHWGDNIDLRMVEAFAHSVRSGEPVPISGLDGLRAVEVALAAYDSVRTGQPAPVMLN